MYTQGSRVINQGLSKRSALYTTVHQRSLDVMRLFRNKKSFSEVGNRRTFGVTLYRYLNWDIRIIGKVIRELSFLSRHGYEATRNRTTGAWK